MIEDRARRERALLFGGRKRFLLGKVGKDLLERGERERHGYGER